MHATNRPTIERSIVLFNPETADGSDADAVSGVGPKLHGPVFTGETDCVPGGPYLGHLRADGGVSAFEWAGAAGESENVARLDDVQT